ncbi:glycoside hydrolase family 19 protein [Hymenobacter weizhouensis]|uniref:glycoside hydrolase family 19 protein n=1 Tax=Hymenobacter sp. YIM 151500-1 TaxID=2987689 RepID=UPI0022274A04|nr:hypothetical protein [Hymenobacter sp. YIM 151500-1]UYZ64378.1 hypothetical protein OIS53_05885 [Hymenobacter sp. YIM 151500-1]
MEYKVRIKNLFSRENVIDLLKGGRCTIFSAASGEQLLRPYIPGTAASFSPSTLNRMHQFNAGRPPVQETHDYALYYLSSKGGMEKDYYLVDSRCLIYDRQIQWAYWETPLIVPVVEGLEVTAAQIKAICPPASMSNIKKHVTHLNEAMRKYKINTRLRQAHFLAQVAHESDHFNTAREYADGSKYEGRLDLGNTEPGDGKRFRGRGLIQLTGRDVYKKYGAYLGKNFIDGTNMFQVEQEPYASDSAGWFWLIYKKSKDINGRADRDDVIAVTRAVNGGRNGLTERIKYTNNAKTVFGIS